MVGRQPPQHAPAPQRRANSPTVQAPDSISARIVLSETTWQWQTIIGPSCAPAPAQKRCYAWTGKNALHEWVWQAAHCDSS